MDDEAPEDYPEAQADYDDRPSRGSRGCGLLGCLLVILLLGGIAAGGMALAGALDPLYDRFLRQPHEVVSEYLAAYRRDDGERARRFLCEGVREGRLLDPRAPVGSGPFGLGGEIDEFPYPRPGGRVAIYYSLDAHGGQAQALLEREDEGWRICAFEPA
jgi:hypothetical protein